MITMFEFDGITIVLITIIIIIITIALCYCLFALFSSRRTNSYHTCLNLMNYTRIMFTPTMFSRRRHTIRITIITIITITIITIITTNMCNIIMIILLLLLL